MFVLKIKEIQKKYSEVQDSFDSLKEEIKDLFKNELMKKFPGFSFNIRVATKAGIEESELDFLETVYIELDSINNYYFELNGNLFSVIWHPYDGGQGWGRSSLVIIDNAPKISLTEVREFLEDFSFKYKINCTVRIDSRHRYR